MAKKNKQSRQTTFERLYEICYRARNESLEVLESVQRDSLIDKKALDDLENTYEKFKEVLYTRGFDLDSSFDKIHTYKNLVREFVKLSRRMFNGENKMNPELLQHTFRPLDTRSPVISKLIIGELDQIKNNIREMYKEQIVDLENARSVEIEKELINKKTFLEKELIKTADPNQKYNLGKEIEELDQKIKEHREG